MRREFADYLSQKGIITEESLQRLADEGWRAIKLRGFLQFVRDGAQEASHEPDRYRYGEGEVSRSSCGFGQS